MLKTSLPLLFYRRRSPTTALTSVPPVFADRALNHAVNISLGAIVLSSSDAPLTNTGILVSLPRFDQ